MIAELLRVVYGYVRPQDDRRHEGSYSPDRRDDAETARNQLLGALIDRGGERCYVLMRRLLEEGAFDPSTPHLRQAAHRMAEVESEDERRRWSEKEVRAFETTWTEPVGTGEQLLALVCELVDDIAAEFVSADESAREVVETADLEHSVQTWLARELRHRAKGRFNVVLEKEVVLRERPDITVVAAGGSVEVAVEVKHGNKRWTLEQLRRALSVQLAEDYLKPAKRRHGLMVISLHKGRIWADKATNASLDFPALIATLQAQAAGILTNRFGSVAVAVRGLDTRASSPGTATKAERNSPARSTKGRADRGSRPTSRTGRR